jgi:hypothetical protein
MVRSYIYVLIQQMCHCQSTPCEHGSSQTSKLAGYPGSKYTLCIHAKSYIAVINKSHHLNIPSDVAALNNLMLDFEGREKLITGSKSI